MTVVKAGDRFGDLIVRQRVSDDPKTRSPNLKKRVRVECVAINPITKQPCGKTETIPTYYLQRTPNPKTHCGCKVKSIKTYFNREYRIWYMMHVRTEDPRHEAYKHYGGRGIRVCAEWHKDAPDGKGFERFLEFVGPSPGPEFSIDRIDNDLGYQPWQDAAGTIRQIRWATAEQQRANQRKPGT